MLNADEDHFESRTEFDRAWDVLEGEAYIDCPEKLFKRRRARDCQHCPHGESLLRRDDPPKGMTNTPELMDFLRIQCTAPVARRLFRDDKPVLDGVMKAMAHIAPPGGQ